MFTLNWRFTAMLHCMYTSECLIAIFLAKGEGERSDYELEDVTTVRKRV